MTSPTDGIERRLGYRRLAEYPIYISAGLETSAIRARWLSTMSQHLIFGAPATALLFALLALALRRTRHLYFEAEKRQEAEEALKHGQRLEALGQLTGGVAHDFNNLLTVIRASVDLLRRPDLPEPRRLRYIEAISDTVTRAAKLTGQLLAFARRQTLKPELFDVGRSVQTLGEMIGTLIGSRIEIVILGAGRTVLHQRRRRPVRDRHHQHGRQRAGRHGRPRPADDYRAHGRRTARRRAALIAKSRRLCRRIRRGYRHRHSARISSGASSNRSSPPSRSARAPGSACRRCSASPSNPAAKWWSPAKWAKAARSRCICRASPASGKSQQLPAEDAPPIDGKGMSVLVVEDNTEVGKFTTDALAELGYGTTLVGNATHALEELAVDADRFDVVFTDVVMPGMTGIELAQEIRRHYADLPVVLTSGYSHVLSEHGSYGFELLQKPYSIEQLSRVLHRIGRWRKVKRANDSDR